MNFDPSVIKNLFIAIPLQEENWYSRKKEHEDALDHGDGIPALGMISIFYNLSMYLGLNSPISEHQGTSELFLDLARARKIHSECYGLLCKLGLDPSK